MSPTKPKPSPPATCSECGEAMETGFVLDGRYQAEWMKGPHEASAWTSTVFRGKERRRIESHRCTACGFLKSYAREISS